MKIGKSYCLTIISIAVVGLTMGCTKTNQDTSALYTPSNANVTATATLQELQQGRTLYVNNCNSCHALVSPESYSPAQWKSILNNMAPRTNLTASEIKLVSKYVTMGN
jgi:cytochrome c5